MADAPVDGRRVVVRVRARRLVCPIRGCRHTFREQVPGRVVAFSLVPATDGTSVEVHVYAYDGTRPTGQVATVVS